MPMIATTIISSISVKPRCRFLIEIPLSDIHRASEAGRRLRLHARSMPCAIELWACPMARKAPPRAGIGHLPDLCGHSKAVGRLNESPRLSFNSFHLSQDASQEIDVDRLLHVRIETRLPAALM